MYTTHESCVQLSLVWVGFEWVSRLFWALFFRALIRPNSAYCFSVWLCLGVAVWEGPDLLTWVLGTFQVQTYIFCYLFIYRKLLCLKQPVLDILVFLAFNRYLATWWTDTIPTYSNHVASTREIILSLVVSTSWESHNKKIVNYDPPHHIVRYTMVLHLST